LAYIDAVFMPGLVHFDKNVVQHINGPLVSKRQTPGPPRTFSLVRDAFEMRDIVGMARQKSTLITKLLSLCTANLLSQRQENLYVDKKGVVA
jgi:hypothetical protein